MCWGTADAVLQNLNLIDDFNADVVAVFGSDHVYRMDVDQISLHQGRRRRDDRRPPGADRRCPSVRRARRGSRGTGRALRREAGTPGAAAGRSRAGARLDGQHIFSRQPLVDALVATRPLHRARLRPLDHSGDGPGRAGLRLRLPAQRGAGREALRGARVLARRRHHLELLGGPHGPPGRVPALRSRQSAVADPQRAPCRTLRALRRRRRRQRPDRRGIARQARDHPQLDPRPLRLGQRGRRDRGLDRHGPYDRREGRPPPSRHHRPIQHHPGRCRDRLRPGRRSPHVSRRRDGTGRGARRSEFLRGLEDF